ncbi:MAG: hypothetical protein V3S14_17080 [Anaerolineae bacterium]
MTKHRRSTKWLHGGADFAIYAVGLLVVVIGAAICYVLALLDKMTEADAAFALTIVATVGFVLVTVGVALRARRQGKKMVGPLIFGLGLLVALTGSLTIYTLALYQAVSERNALIGLTSAMILAVLLSSMGVVWRTYRVERGEARRVVLGPLNKIYTRRIEEYQNEQDK